MVTHETLSRLISHVWDVDVWLTHGKNPSLLGAARSLTPQNLKTFFTIPTPRRDLLPERSGCAERRLDQAHAFQ